LKREREFDITLYSVVLYRTRELRAKWDTVLNVIIWLFVVFIYYIFIMKSYNKYREEKEKYIKIIIK